MEYQIVYLDSINHPEKSFEKIVNSEIKKGWIPQGGVSVENGRHFYQAMVKE